MTGDRLTSTIFIPPHLPGNIHIDLKFVDSGDYTKTKSNTAVDLIVDQGYSGSLRLGISGILGTDEHTYSSVQRSKDGPKEIIEQSVTPIEVVAGYSVYINALLTPEGRTYNLIHGDWAWRRLGAFIGFGAVSYTPGSIDFLRSIYIGPELELSRNISIAGTFVLRRGTELSKGFFPGGPAPESGIPTDTSYRAGFAIVLAISTDFVKFTTGAAK